MDPSNGAVSEPFQTVSDLVLEGRTTTFPNFAVLKNGQEERSSKRRSDSSDTNSIGSSDGSRSLGLPVSPCHTLL